MKSRTKFLSLGASLALIAGLFALAIGSDGVQTDEMAAGTAAAAPATVAQSNKQTPGPAAPAVQRELEEVEQAAPTMPLSSYAGFGHDVDGDEEQYEKEELAREQYISQCMNNMGFTYVPAPSISLDDIEELDREAFDAAVAEAAMDPNDAYVESLSPSARETYYIALTGVPDPNAREAAELPDFTTGGGCLGEALRKIPGVYAAFHNLREQFDSMEDNFYSDPRIAVANEEWSRCMENRGLQFASPSALRAALDESGIELLQTGAGEEQYALLEAEQEKTIATARVCDGTTALSQTITEIRAEYEAKFVSEHHKALESLGDDG